MLVIVVEFFLALAIALVVQNVAEWVVHNFVLHRMGANKNSFFHYHWEHHNRCRKTNNADIEYVDFFYDFRLSSMLKKELAMMTGLTLFVAGPIYLYLWPMLGLATAIVVWYYFFIHAWSHAGTDKNVLPWHRDHHMGSDQNLNWCVSFPWFDWLAKTRVKNAPKHYGAADLFVE